MIIPVRCFTCGKPVANKYEKYLKLVDEQNKKCNYKSNQDPRIDREHIFKELKLKRYCCRRMVLTHVDIAHTLN